MQIHPGHAILEKRKPALLDSFLQVPPAARPESNSVKEDGIQLRFRACFVIGSSLLAGTEAEFGPSSVFCTLHELFHVACLCVGWLPRC